MPLKLSNGAAVQFRFPIYFDDFMVIITFYLFSLTDARRVCCSIEVQPSVTLDAAETSGMEVFPSWLTRANQKNILNA